MQKFLTTGDVAKLAKVGTETIRFYERKGIIEEPPRSQSGYRQYTTTTVQKIQFIKLAQDLGFTLKDIGELLALKVDNFASCSRVKLKTEAKLLEITSKIKDLKRIQRSLKKLTDSCDKNKNTKECPILDSLK